ANASKSEIGDEAEDVSNRWIQGVDVEYDGATHEEVRGVLGPAIEVVQPLPHRSFGRQHEGHKGFGEETDGLLLDGFDAVLGHWSVVGFTATRPYRQEFELRNDFRWRGRDPASQDGIP